MSREVGDQHVERADADAAGRLERLGPVKG
jgi:hypothetical protein